MIKTCIVLALILAFLGCSGTRAVKSIIFGIEVTGHLKRAADANTVELAIIELETALTYLKKKGMTEGYTSVLYNTPDEDIGFLYINLSQSLAELKSLSDSASTLEKSNTLMKLRETILDDGEKGSKVTKPFGISIFPNNTAFAFCGWTIFLSLSGLLGKFIYDES